MKNSEIAEKAAEIIEENGWVRGRYRDSNGFCLLGAGMKAASYLASYERVGQVFLPGTDLLPGTDWDPENMNISYSAHYYVPLFNDKRLSSKGEAIEACMKAAKYWRDKGE